LAQHPATLDTGGEFASRFFPPMYAKASALQIALAVTGTIAGVASWYQTGGMYWIVGAILLISVVPITLLFIKPINDQLLKPDHGIESEQIVALLKQWNPRHWVRSIASFASFLCYLIAMSG